MAELKVDYAAIRQKNLQRLTQKQFKVAGSLPHGPRGENDGLRPIDQIAKRLWALNALFHYIADMGQNTPKKVIRNCATRSRLAEHLTPSESEMFRSWRWLARKRHLNSVGWRLENMLPLAWILGFPIAPSVDGEMLNGEPLCQMIEFVGDVNEDFGKWLKSRSPRTEYEVIDKEDLFYCAHNAVRSAQLGERCVPKTFHPVMNGGVVHERRHALTWAISPGVNWDDTDLST